MDDVLLAHSNPNSMINPKRILGKDAPSRARQEVRVGDTLFSTVRVYLKNIAIVPESLDGAICSTGFCVLRPSSEIHPRYLFRYVTRDEFVNVVTPIQTGTMYPAVKQKDVLSPDIKYPSLSKQESIVAKIDESYSSSHRVKQELSRIPTLTRRLRMAILWKAFRGELTNHILSSMQRSLDWSEDVLEVIEKRKKKSRSQLQPTRMETKNLPPIPSNCSWIQIRDVASLVQYGTSTKMNDDDKEIPVLRMGNIDDGIIVYDKLKYLPSDSIEKDKYLLEEGDILFNRTNSAELVGKSAVFTGKKDTLFASYLIRIRTYLDLFLPELLCYYINSPHGRSYIDSVRTQQVGQANVNGTKLVSMPIPLIPLEEQQEMLRIISQTFFSARTIEHQTDQSLTTIGQLESSILTQAFQGQLLIYSNEGDRFTNSDSEQTSLDEFN